MKQQIFHKMQAFIAMLETKFVLHAHSLTNEDNLYQLKREKSVSMMTHQGLQSEWLGVRCYDISLGKWQKSQIFLQMSPS